MFIRNHLMVQIGSFGKAQCEARCGSSGERCNAADGPIWTTEGRVFTSAGKARFALWPVRPQADRNAVSGRENPVKLIPYKHEALQAVMWRVQFSSRSLNLWIFPVWVFGNRSRKAILRGYL